MPSASPSILSNPTGMAEATMRPNLTYPTNGHMPTFSFVIAQSSD
jgi:hypothetical protein